MALNSSKALLSINQRLPPEILSEIFILCPTAPMRITDAFLVERDISIPSHLHLTLVCKSWHSIVESTPELWTSLKIYIPYRNIPQRIKDIQRWISRSGQLPLSITIHRHSSPPGEFSDSLMGDLVNLVKIHSHRWESLETTLAPELLRHFRDSIGSTSILKTLLIFPPCRIMGSRREPFSIGSFPSPTCVSLNTGYIWPLGIYWDNVTRFTARYMGIGQTLEILRLSPQLQEFILFSLLRENGANRLPSSPILHARLETLSIGYLPSGVLPYQLIDNMTLPSLKHLNITAFHLQNHSIIDFLDRSECLLETCSIHDVDVSEDAIIDLLFAMPHLETLTLDSKDITDTFLNILAETAPVSSHLHGYPDGSFLPKLHSLKCIHWPLFSWSCLSVAFGFNESGRSKSLSSDRRPLRSFTVVQDVDDPYYPEANDVAELQRLREEGCIVDFVFGRVDLL